MSIFSDEELTRYNRHLILPEIGLEGQQKLKSGSVLIVGAGGLGSPAAMYLAAAGIGKIGIVDYDVVEMSNLQRQILHGTKNLGKPKLESAKVRLKDINPFSKIETWEVELSSNNALEIFEGYDVILDGTDNFPARYLINDACVLTNKTNIYASIYRFEGQISVFNYNDGPCYRCFHPQPPRPGEVPSCAEGGVLGVLPGVMGALQANEAIKVVTGAGNVAAGRVIVYDALELRFTELKLDKDRGCVVCGENPDIDQLIDYKKFCGILPAKKSTDSNLQDNQIDVFGLKQKRDNNEDFILLDVREDFEYDIAHIEGSILIPLSELDARITELSHDEKYVVMCKLGGRSARAVEFMESHGFSDVKNLVGGIREWTAKIDDGLADY